MKKSDYSLLSHTPPRKRPPLLPPFKDALIILGGGHPGTARLVSSEEEILTFMILGTVLLLASCMTASTVTTVLHSASGDGNFHIGYLFVGVLVGAMQGAADNILQYRTKFTERGYAQVAVAGTQLPLLVRSGVETIMLNVMRCLQSVSISILAALGIVLIALSSSTTTFTANKFRMDNPVVYAEATKQVDGAIKSTSDDVSSSTGRIEQINKMLTSLRLENTRRAVRSRTPGLSASAPDTQIAKLESTLAAETSNRDGLKATLTKLLASREADIEQKIETSPNVIPKLTGLSGQLDAAIALVKDDWGLLIITLSLQIVSCALELSPMWITTRYFPSNYATHIAVERFLAARAMAERCAEQLEGRDTSKSSQVAADARGVSDAILDRLTTGTRFEPVVETAEPSPPVMPMRPVEAPTNNDTARATATGRLEATFVTPAPSAGPSGPPAAQQSIADALGLRPRRQRSTREDRSNAANGVDHD